MADEKPIDVTKIKGRQMNKTQAYGKMWQEAHKLFLDKVKNREKTEV